MVFVFSFNIIGAPCGYCFQCVFNIIGAPLLFSLSISFVILALFGYFGTIFYYGAPAEVLKGEDDRTLGGDLAVCGFVVIF